MLADPMGELYDIVTVESDQFTLARAERGSKPVFAMSSKRVEDVERHLTCLYGADIRLLERLPFIYHAWEKHAIKPGWNIEQFPHQWILFDPTGRLRAVFGGDQAIRYSWIAESPLAQIRQSYLHRDGLPLFPNHWIGPAVRIPAPVHLTPAEAGGNIGRP